MITENEKSQSEKNVFNISVSQTDLENIPVIYLPSTSQALQQEDQSAILDVSQLSDDSLSCSTVSADSFCDIPIASRSAIKHFDLEGFLKADIFGNALLCKGMKENLSPVDRDRLCELLIKHLLNRYGKLTSAELRFLSEKIQNLFPGEFEHTYFVAPIKKCDSSRNISEKAKGKLVDKQRNLLYILRSLSKVKDKQKTEGSSKATSEGKYT